jgi:hypothetical protein
MALCTLPTLSCSSQKVGGKLICTKHQILFISTHKKAKIGILLTTSSYPYRYSCLVHIQYGGNFMCFCEWDDLDMEIIVGAVGYDKKMPYMLKTYDEQGVIICMPPNQTTGEGGVASLSKLCHSALLLANYTQEYMNPCGLPITVVSSCMISPKRRLTMSDDLGNKKVTCKNSQHCYTSQVFPLRSSADRQSLGGPPGDLGRRPPPDGLQGKVLMGTRGVDGDNGLHP